MSAARLYLYNESRLLMLRQRRRVFLRRAAWAAVIGAGVGVYLIYSIQLSTTFSV